MSIDKKYSNMSFYIINGFQVVLLCNDISYIILRTKKAYFSTVNDNVIIKKSSCIEKRTMSLPKEDKQTFVSYIL